MKWHIAREKWNGRASGFTYYTAFCGVDNTTSAAVAPRHRIPEAWDVCKRCTAGYRKYCEKNLAKLRAYK